MEEIKKSTKEESKENFKKKASYEELEKSFIQLSRQYEMLRDNYQKQYDELKAKYLESVNNNLFTRLEFLFKPLQVNSEFFTKEFLINCAKEIERTMVLPDSEVKENKKE